VPRGDVFIQELAPMGDDTVVVIDEDGHVTAVDVASGTQRWSKDLQATYSDVPVFVGGTLVVTVEGGLALVDPATGEVHRSFSVAAPFVEVLPGEPPALLVTDTQSLQAIDLEGNTLWTTDVPIDVLAIDVGNGMAVVTDTDGNIATFSMGA
jgi:outer membrane protein assembly factor BamB